METVSLAQSFPAGSEGSRPVSISRALGKVVVTVRGDVGGDLARILHRVLVDLVDGLGSLDIILDLRRIDSLDPIGVETVADITERAARRGTVFTVSDPYGKIRRDPASDDPWRPDPGSSN